jgi:hypothetical protein
MAIKLSEKGKIRSALILIPYCCKNRQAKKRKNTYVFVDAWWFNGLTALAFDGRGCCGVFFSAAVADL